MHYIRRTALGSAGAPPADALTVAAQIAATELGWDETRTAQELASVRQFYELAK